MLCSVDHTCQPRSLLHNFLPAISVVTKLSRDSDDRVYLKQKQSASVSLFYVATEKLRAADPNEVECYTCRVHGHAIGIFTLSHPHYASIRAPPGYRICFARLL